MFMWFVGPPSLPARSGDPELGPLWLGREGCAGNAAGWRCRLGGGLQGQRLGGLRQLELTVRSFILPLTIE